MLSTSLAPTQSFTGPKAKLATIVEREIREVIDDCGSLAAFFQRHLVAPPGQNID